MRRYLVVFEKSKTGYSAYVPDLPGCIATGRTKEEAEELIYEVIQLHIEGLVEDGVAIPEPVSESEIVILK